MSAPPPTPSLPLPIASSSPMTTAASTPSLTGPVSSAAWTPPAPAPAVLTPEEMTAALRDLTQAVQGIRTFLAGHYGLQPPAPVTTITGPQQLPWQPPPPATSVASIMPLPQQQQPPPPPPVISGPGLPSTAPGVPIHQVRFPPSPSPLPAWLAGSIEPVYTMASGQPHVLSSPAPPQTMQFGGSSGAAGPYDGVDGPLFHGGTLQPAHSAPSPSLFRADDSYPPVVHAQPPPRFSKLEFATYDGTVDPLNWLNQCDQFFRGQRTLASDRTWIASYHLRGAAQTWYYALEQDEGGMPPWERFRELCLLRFGPPIRGSRLAELGRLPFLSTVQDFADRFQALACHASGVTARQRAELFVGGLPDHIRVDVEMRGPQDLQTAMYYARAFERRAVAIQQAPPPRAAGPPPWPEVPAQGRPAQASAAPLAAAAARPFRRLTPAEQLERRRQGLCFNCDEPYVPGHVCPRLFYLEAADYIEEDTAAAGLGDLPAPVDAEVFGGR